MVSPRMVSCGRRVLLRPLALNRAPAGDPTGAWRWIAVRVSLSTLFAFGIKLTWFRTFMRWEGLVNDVGPEGAWAAAIFVSGACALLAWLLASVTHLLVVSFRQRMKPMR